MVPLKALDEDSSARTHVESLAPVVLSTGRTRSEQSKPSDSSDLNEVREEQRVLNNNALLKQYLYNDSLNNVVLDENKETASYHVVPGAEENANWQKASESLIQLGKNKVNTSQTSPNNRVMSYPVEEGEEDDSKEATRFQSQVIQDDDMLTKDEGDDNGAPSTGENDGDELGEGEEREQAAKIQSLMKQEDDMLQNQEAEEDEESSGSKNAADGASSGKSNVDTNTVVSNNDMTNSSSNPFAKSNESLLNSINTAKQQQQQQQHYQKPAAFYASGIALNNNPNFMNESTASNDEPSLGSFGNISSSSFPGHLMTNQSSLNIHQETSSGSSSNGSLKIEQKGDKATAIVEPSNNSSTQNDKVITTKGTQSIMLNHNKMANQGTNQATIQQLGLTAGTVAPGSTNTISSAGRNGMGSVNLSSSPTVLSSQAGMKPSQQHIGIMPIMSNSQSRLTLSDMIVPGASMKPKEKSPDVSHLEATRKQPQQSGSPTVNQHPISAASGSLKNENSTLVSNRLSPGSQATGTNAAVQSPILNPIKASDSVSDVHHVSSPALITLPSASNRPIKLVFHVQDMKSNGMSSNAPVSGSETVTGYQSTPVLNDDLANKMNDEGK